MQGLVEERRMCFTTVKTKLYIQVMYILAINDKDVQLIDVVLETFCGVFICIHENFNYYFLGHILPDIHPFSFRKSKVF